LNIRTGLGYDIHRLVENRKLFLGGVEIPSEKGSLGHSDADVLLHAICDALLGAAALGDIGKHFPDNNIKYKDISSLKLLDEVRLLLEMKNSIVINIDSTIVLERPKIGKYVDEMRKNIAEHLKISLSQVSIKATTSEGLGPIGNYEGISAYAIALIEANVS
jgi:2-C-methyl-D-erythritol 2,4-cyclodiphosphate synthase